MAEDHRLRELMREYQSGRFEAFDEIYASIAPALRRYLLSQARDAAKADDLVQETFLQMHRARHTYDASYPLMPWAMAIARHVWLMDRRTLSRRPWAPDDVTAMDLPVKAEAALSGVDTWPPTCLSPGSCGAATARCECFAARPRGCTSSTSGTAG